MICIWADGGFDVSTKNEEAMGNSTALSSGFYRKRGHGTAVSHCRARVQTPQEVCVCVWVV